METFLIKLGGSVITKKGSQPVHIRVIKRLALELKGFKEKIILVHGTGHIGKPPAIKYGYVKTQSLPKNKAHIALQIRNNIIDLNCALIKCFSEVGIPAVGIDNTHFLGYLDRGWKSNNIKDLIESLTAQGTIPVFYGNLLPQANGSYKILSSDELMLTIARIVSPDKIIFLSDVDGVFNSKRKLLAVVQKKILKEIMDNPKDVSGGMKTKVKTALSLRMYCKECYIANGKKKNVLRDILNNENVPGSRIA